MAELTFEEQKIKLKKEHQAALDKQKEIEKKLSNIEKQEEQEKTAKHNKNLADAKKHIKDEFKKLLKNTITKYELDSREFNYAITKEEQVKDKVPSSPCPKFFYIDEAGKSHYIIGRIKKNSIWINKPIDFINKHKVTHSLKVGNEWKVWNEQAGDKPAWFKDATKVNVENIEISHSKSIALPK